MPEAYNPEWESLEQEVKGEKISIKVKKEDFLLEDIGSSIVGSTILWVCVRETSSCIEYVHLTLSKHALALSSFFFSFPLPSFLSLSLSREFSTQNHHLGDIHNRESPSGGLWKKLLEDERIFPTRGPSQVLCIPWLPLLTFVHSPLPILPVGCRVGFLR